MHCDDGYIGYGSECTCPQLECRIAHARIFLPSLAAFTKYYIYQNDCNLALGAEFVKDIKLRSTFSRGRGYPLDVDNKQCDLRVNYNQYNVEKVYHPCSVSIGKFIRFNSLFLYHRYAAKASGDGPSLDALVDVEYPHEWKWAKGLSACQKATNEPPRRQGWNCAFQDLSETVTRHSTNRNTPPPLSVVPGGIVLLRTLKRTRPDSAAQVPLYGKLLELLATPSDLVKQYMQQHVVIVSPSGQWDPPPSQPLHGLADALEEGSRQGCDAPSPPAVSMHVRHGDSCDFESLQELSGDPFPSYAARGFKRPCFAIAVYLSRLQELRDRYGVRRVYLATDSQAMIDYVHASTTDADSSNDFEWIFINVSRKVFDISNGWVDFFNSSTNDMVTFSAVADLDLMKRGDIFLGAFSSHFSKLGYYIMAGYKMRLPPFVSLDLPLSCDTVDACGMANIMSRRQRVVDIIRWAPECLRKWDGGWLEDDRDPCGVYAGGV